MQGDDDGVFSRRVVIPELFDRATIEAVLSEWFKTLYSLPSGLRMAVEMVRDPTSNKFACTTESVGVCSHFSACSSDED